MWSDVPGSVVSGVLVALVLGAARLLWHRRRVPTALSRRVRRGSYLRTVLAESRRATVRRLDVLAPRLTPAKGDEIITRIQSAWADINRRGEVRVLTLESDDSLQAGAELLRNDVEVQVARRDLDSESLTFHLFESADPAGWQAIINHHHGGADKPNRIVGAAPVVPFRSHFDKQWRDSRPLESVIAEMILGRSADHRDVEAVLGSLAQARATLSLDAHSTRSILPHLAFRNSGAVVFILGQPGAGKSYVRCLLAEQLRTMRMDCEAITDYPYAYLDHVRTSLRFTSQARKSYQAYEGGAFIAKDEAALAPALRALAGAVRDSAQAHDVTLVEFARPDLRSALEEFENVRTRAQVIHVSAPADLRLSRLSNRVVPPEASVSGEVVTLRLSDNHLLPAPAQQALYALDGIESLRESSRWRGRIFEIDNGCDGAGHVETDLDEFIRKIVDPYVPEDVKRSSRDPIAS
jgi:dephospho-CoA kinase